VSTTKLVVILNASHFSSADKLDYFDRENCSDRYRNAKILPPAAEGIRQSGHPGLNHLGSSSQLMDGLPNKTIPLPQIHRMLSQGRYLFTVTQSDAVTGSFLLIPSLNQS
jgi:hypothetical protein